jgi:hypothetical protein
LIVMDYCISTNQYYLSDIKSMNPKFSKWGSYA